MATLIATESRDTAAARRGGTCRRYSPHADVLAVGPIMQSIFQLAARQQTSGSGKACHRAGD